MNRNFGNAPKAEAKKQANPEKELYKSIGLKEPSPAAIGLTQKIF